MIHFWESIRQSWKFRKGYWVKTDAFPFSSSLQLTSVLEEDMGCSGLKADVWILLYLPCCLCSKCYSNLLPFKESIQDPKLLPVFAFTTALKLDRLFQKNKSVIFKQRWRRLHMCLLHFQSSTLTSLIGGWMKRPPASPNTNLIQSVHLVSMVTEWSPARLLIPPAFCALLSETGSCRQSTEHPWPASCRLTRCHTNSLLKFVTS